MSRRVLLLSANRCVTPDPVFPLGLAHVNAALREAGYETRWVDVQCAGEPLEQVLAEFGPAVVGISIRNIDDVLIRRQETYFGEVVRLVARIRAARSCPIVVGGSGFSIFPEELLRLSGADYGIQGEGESGFPALVESLRLGSGVERIPGLVWRDGDRVMTNPPAPGIVGGVLEPGDRPASISGHYLRTGGMLNVQTQRGCAHTCCYCTYPLIEGRHHRRSPPESVAEEFARLDAQGVRYVFVVDSIFNTSERHVVETCEAIRRRRLRLRWGCFLRPAGLTPGLLARMREAGLEHAEFGSDSFCDRVLEEYGKRFGFEDILRAHEAARAAEIEACHFLICGGPGETPETLEETHLNSLSLKGAVVMAMVGMRIYPGTALHGRALKEGVIRPDTPLLEPVYYVARGLTMESVFERLAGFAGRSPNWIVGEPAPEYLRLVERLRSRGVSGPLWSYFALLQRFHRAAATPVAFPS